MILYGVILVFILFFSLAILFLIQGPQYVPSGTKNAEHILTLVNRINPHLVLDLGSGDGRLVLLLAQSGVRAEGVEINPLLVLRSRRMLKRAGYAHETKIYWGNFWNYSISEYDLVVLFAIKHIMPSLERKMKNELKPQSYIISNYFTLPNLHPLEKIDDIRLYQLSNDQ